MILFVFLVTEDDCDDSTHQDTWQIKSQWYIYHPSKVKALLFETFNSEKDVSDFCTAGEI